MIPPFVTFLEQRLHKMFSEWLFSKKKLHLRPLSSLLSRSFKPWSVYFMGNRSRQRFFCLLRGKKKILSETFWRFWLFWGKKNYRFGTKIYSLLSMSEEKWNKTQMSFFFAHRIYWEWPYCKHTTKAMHVSLLNAVPGPCRFLTFMDLIHVIMDTIRWFFSDPYTCTPIRKSQYQGSKSSVLRLISDFFPTPRTILEISVNLKRKYTMYVTFDQMLTLGSEVYTLIWQHWSTGPCIEWEESVAQWPQNPTGLQKKEMLLWYNNVKFIKTWQTKCPAISAEILT